MTIYSYGGVLTIDMKLVRVPKYARHVQMTLNDLHRLRERRFNKADYIASDTIMDLERAIKDAELTEKQADVIYYLHVKDLSQLETAERMNISQQAVSSHNIIAIKKIAKEY